MLLAGKYIYFPNLSKERFGGLSIVYYALYIKCTLGVWLYYIQNFEIYLHNCVYILLNLFIMILGTNKEKKHILFILKRTKVLLKICCMSY